MDYEKERINGLTERLQGGDKSAFDEFYKLTSPKAYFIALKITRNEHDAEDILQESYIKALEKLGATCTLRQGVKKAGPVITDNGNLILDLLWKSAPDAAEMEAEINKIVGVVENGFFCKNVPTVFVAHADGSVTER